MRKYGFVVIVALTIPFTTNVLIAKFNGRNKPPQQSIEQLRARISEMVAQEEVNMKRRLEMTDAEWLAIKPLFLKVTSLNSQLSNKRAAIMMSGINSQQIKTERTGEKSELEKARESLSVLLNADNPSGEQIKAKLSVLRSVREKIRTDLVKAQGELCKRLTVKQEATLVMIGVLL